MSSERKASAVDALIAAAKSAKRRSRFTDEMIEDLRQLMEHNDSVEGKRISASVARKLLTDEHGVSVGLSQFSAAIEEIFGRKWGGK